MCFLPLKSSHYPSRPVPVPELFGKYPTRPVPKSKTPTRQTLVKIPGDQQWFESSKKARKPEITTFWIEKCPKCLRCPGTQTSQNLVGKMCKNKF